MDHAWIFKRTDGNDNVWGCSRCSVEVGFNKPGVGEPSASTSSCPANVADYASPSECLVAETDSRAFLRIFAKTLDRTTLVLAGKITQAEADKLAALAAES